MMGSRKPMMDFGEEGEDFIDSILSREETEDIITMLIDAEESQDCLHLPRFHTSSQIGGGDLGREPNMRSFSMPLSPIQPGQWGLNEDEQDLSRKIGDFETSPIVTTGPDKVIRDKNWINLNSTCTNEEKKFELISRQDAKPDPGTVRDSINSPAMGRGECHDPDLSPGAGGDTVTKHVAMGNNVATGNVVTGDGEDVTKSEQDQRKSEGAGGQDDEEKVDEPRVPRGNSDEDTKREDGDEVKDEADGSGASEGKSDDGTERGDNSRLKEILSKMDLVEEILSMMGDKSNRLSTTVRNFSGILPAGD